MLSAGVFLSTGGQHIGIHRGWTISRRTMLRLTGYASGIGSGLSLGPQGGNSVSGKCRGAGWIPAGGAETRKKPTSQKLLVLIPIENRLSLSQEAHWPGSRR